MYKYIIHIYNAILYIYSVSVHMAMKTCGSLAELEDGHQAINRDLYHHCKDSNCGMDDHHPKTMSIDHGKYMLLLDCGHLMRQAVL